MKALMIFALLAAPLAAERDFLSADEADQVREAQDPNQRLSLYVVFARQRLSQVDHWLASDKPGRSILIHDALDDYANLIDAMDTVADDALRRHVDIQPGLTGMINAEREMLARLQKLQDSNPKDLGRYNFVLKQSLDATNDSLETAQENPAVRAKEIAARDRKEKKEREQSMAPAEREERKAEQAKEDREKEKKKAPTLLRPGEKVQGKDDNDQN